MIKNLLISACLFISFYSNAQQVLSFGPRIGINASTTLGADAPEGQFKTGFNTGVFVTFSSKHRLAVTSEINYSQKGEVYDDQKIRLALNYVEIPLYLRYFLSKGNIRPNIFAGPQVGFNMAAFQKFINSKKDVSNNVKDFEFSGLAGFGVNFKHGANNWINLDLRYNQGTTSIYNKNSDTQKNMFSNAVISLNIAYAFGLN